MTRQLASRQVEGEAAINPPAPWSTRWPVVPQAARPWDSARDSARRSGRIRPACGRASGPTGAGLARGRISGPRQLQPQRGHRGSAGAGRASAWARFMAAPVRSLHIHSVEPLAQVVCRLIGHIVRGHWARPPVQRAVSCWVPIDGGLWIVPADRGCRERSKRQRAARSPVHDRPPPAWNRGSGHGTASAPWALDRPDRWRPSGALEGSKGRPDAAPSRTEGSRRLASSTLCAIVARAWTGAGPRRGKPWTDPSGVRSEREGRSGA
jgi:hypothetical protein